MQHRTTTAAALLLGLLTISVGTVTAQTEEPVAQPVPSYVPMPAADPVAAVNAFLDALDAGQWSVLPALACSTEREGFAASYDPAAQTFFSPEAVQQLFESLDVAIADRAVAVTSSDEESATLSLAGTLTWTISDEGLSAFVEALAAEASPAPSADEKDLAARSLRSTLESRALAPEVQVVAEDGGWLVCSDLLTTAEVQE
jgi:hypothetical protein